MNSIVIGKSTSGPVTLDVSQLISSRLLVTAGSGGGKSWLLRKILEEVSATTQTLVIDPEGEFASLRELRDMVLVGPDGDLPADPRSAGLLARRLMEMNVSAVLDIFELPPRQRREFVANFCTAMVNMDKSLWRNCFIAIDEAHEFAPNSKDGDYVSTEPMGLLFSKGRKRGYCPIVATQRLAKLSMDVAAEARTRFIGLATLDLDQKRAADFLGFSKDRWTELRDLSPPGHEGQFFGVGPALTERGVVKFRTDHVKTTHPQPGMGLMPQPPEPSQKIRSVLAELTDLPKQADEEANTLAEAKRQIIDLQVKLKSVKAPPPLEVASKKEQRIIQQLKQGLEEAMNVIAKITATGFDKTGIDPSLIEGAIKSATAQVVKLVETDLTKKAAEFDRFKREVNSVLLKLRKLVEQDSSVNVSVKHNEPVTITSDTSTRVEYEESEPRDNRTREQKFLDAAAALQTLKVDTTRETVSGWVGVHPRGGSVGEVLNGLASAGLIVLDRGNITVTEDGFSRAGRVDPAEAIKQAKRGLGKRQREFFELIAAAYPDGITREQIAEAKSLHPRGGSLGEDLGALVGRGLVTRDRGTYRARDFLFAK